MMRGGLAITRCLAASDLLRAVASSTPAADVAGAGAAADAITSGSLLFASGRLTWGRSFSSLHQHASPDAAAPGALPSSTHAVPTSGASTASASQAAGTAHQPADSGVQKADVPGAALHAQLPARKTRQRASATGLAAADAGAAPGERHRMKWKLDFNIEWTSQLAAAAHSFWQAQGVTSLRKLKRLARWTELSPLFRNLPQLGARMTKWREVGHRLGRSEQDILDIVLSERAVIEKGADPDRIIGNLIAIEGAFAAHNLSPEGVRRSRVLQNKTDTIVERIPMFINEVAKWPIKADYGAMLERNPGLLASHSTNFAVYGERVAALHAWAPEGLDLGKVLVRAPTLLNLFPDLVQRRYTALKALLQLDDKQMSRIVLSGPTLLSRRTETLKWKLGHHRAYAEHRAAAGHGDELQAFYEQGQFPSRLCNLLLQSVERLQRLRFLLERHARNSDVMSQAGYSWVRRSSPSWHTLFPDFADWVAAHPPDPGPGPRAGKGGRSEKAASESSSSDAEAEQK